MRPGKHQRSKQRCQDLCWKVQDPTKSFVFPLYTMHEVSSSALSEQLLCFVQGQGQKSEQFKHTTNNFDQFRYHSPLLTTVWPDSM